MKTAQMLERLISYKTTRGNFDQIHECFQWIDKQLSFYPWKIQKYVQNGVESWVWSTHITLQPSILLNAHIDVVPASASMFSMKSQNGKYIGRGVSDMKFAVVSFIQSLETYFAIHKNLPEVAIMITSDEEVGGMNGVGYLVKEVGYRPGVVIIPDGGDNWHIVEEAKGVMHLKVTTHGTSAHASMPWEGVNAIDALSQGLVLLRQQYPQPSESSWETTINYGQVHGGTQTNQVCDEASIVMDVRYIPIDSPDKIMSRVSQCFDGADIECVAAADPFHIDWDNSYTQTWGKIVQEYQTGEIRVKEHGASDGRYFTKHKIPVILCKPRGGAIHTDHEWIDQKGIEMYTNALTQFLASFSV